MPSAYSVDDVFRDYEVGSSGAAHKPSKAEIRALLKQNFITPFDIDKTAGSGGDDTATMQAAVADPRPLYVPAGFQFKTAADATWAGTATKMIWGSGLASILTMTNATQNGITKNGTGALLVRGLTINSSVNKTAGSAIYLAGGPSIQDTVDGCFLGGASYLYKGVHSAGDVLPALKNCYFLNNTYGGIVLDNQNAFGGVEADIYGCTFDAVAGAATGASSIIYLGGLGTTNIIGCRSQNVDYGVNIIPVHSTTNPATKLSFNISDSSFENNNVGSIVASLPSGSEAVVQSLNVSGSDFFQGSGQALITSPGSNVNWILLTRFNDNTVRFNGDRPVRLFAGVSAMAVGNEFYTAVANTAAIETGPSAPSVFMHGPNAYYNTDATKNVFAGNSGISNALVGKRAATATAGGAGSLPATVKTYIRVPLDDGTWGKVPVYAD